MLEAVVAVTVGRSWRVELSVGTTCNPKKCASAGFEIAVTSDSSFLSEHSCKAKPFTLATHTPRLHSVPVRFTATKWQSKTAISTLAFYSQHIAIANGGGYFSGRSWHTIIASQPAIAIVSAATVVASFPRLHSPIVMLSRLHAAIRSTDRGNLIKKEKNKEK